MNPEKKKHLEGKGWQLGSADEFLDLTPDQAALVELWRADSAYDP